jgi:hypothetical protein
MKGRKEERKIENYRYGGSIVDGKSRYNVGGGMMCSSIEGQCTVI